MPRKCVIKLSLLWVAAFGMTGLPLLVGCYAGPTGFLATAGSTHETAPPAASKRSFSDVAGMATLTPINQSGVHARIEFVDDGATLTVFGEAAGLEPAESYVTLIYDNGSAPGGPNPCAPTIFNPQDPGFLLATMLIGFWSVDADGNGTLFAINTNFGADYVPLDRFRSTSVRLVTGPPPAPGRPPATELVACGHVADQPQP